MARSFCVLVIAAWLGMTLPVRAESPQEPAAYRATIELALSELGAGNLDEARTHFLAAHELFPNARTFRGLGFVAFEQRHYVEAVPLLAQSLASDVRPLEGRLREETEALLLRARGYTGALHLVLTPADAHAQVDDVPVDTAAPIVLNAGDHQLAVAAEGFVSQRRSVQITGGRQLDLEVRLDALDANRGPVALEPPHREAPDSSAKRRRRWWWSMAGLAAAGAITTVAVLAASDTSTEPRAVAGANTPGGAAIATTRGFP